MNTLFKIWVVLLLSVYAFTFNAHALTTSSSAECANGSEPVYIDSTFIQDQTEFIRYGSDIPTKDTYTFNFSGLDISAHYLSSFTVGWDLSSEPTTYSDTFGVINEASEGIFEKVYDISNPITSGVASSGGYSNIFKFYYNSYVCSNPPVQQTCPDGGVPLNGNCDRKCSEIDMGSLTVADLGGGYSDICIQIASQDDRDKECITTCGGTSANVTSNSYNVLTGSSDCRCKTGTSTNQNDLNNQQSKNDSDNELDNRKDNNSNSNPDDDSDTLTDEFLQQIRDNLSDNTSLLEENNNTQSDIKTNSDDISQNTSDMVSSLDDIGTSLDDLNDKTEEGNGFLEDIYGAMSDYLTWYFANDALVADEISSSDINTKMSDLSDSISDVEEGTYDFTEINFEAGQGGFISTAFSKYSDLLGLSTSYGSKPSNMTMSIFGSTYTILNFSLLDPFISILRNLFLSLAYFSGFMIFVRKG